LKYQDRAKNYESVYICQSYAYKTSGFFPDTLYIILNSIGSYSAAAGALAFPTFRVSSLSGPLGGIFLEITSDQMTSVLASFGCSRSDEHHSLTSRK